MSWSLCPRSDQEFPDPLCSIAIQDPGLFGFSCMLSFARYSCSMWEDDGMGFSQEPLEQYSEGCI